MRKWKPQCQVSDCRENIEAVHYITSQCTRCPEFQHNFQPSETKQCVSFSCIFGSDDYCTTMHSETFCSRLQALRLFATDPLLPYSEISNLSQLRYLEIQFDTFYREHRDDFLHRLGQLQNLQVLKIPTCFGLSDSQALSLISSCASLTHLSLPCNSKIAGWVLESLLQTDHRATSPSYLEHLTLTVNTAYVPLTSCIPEPLATVLVEEAKTSLNLSVAIAFTHKKLPSFNPKGFCDSNDCSFWLDIWSYRQYISKTLISRY